MYAGLLNILKLKDHSMTFSKQDMNDIRGWPVCHFFMKLSLTILYFLQKINSITTPSDQYRFLFT